MKFFRYFIAAMLLIGLSGVAHASSWRVLDPTGSQPGAPLISSSDLGNPISFSFYNCDFFTADGCFAAVNDTGSTITSFSATITGNTTLPDTGLTCPAGGFPGYPDAFTSVDSCNISGNTITVSFSGGGVPSGSTLWIVEDGIPDSDFNTDAGTFTVTATPEPSSLLLALSSMGPLGYMVRRRRRNPNA